MEAVHDQRTIKQDVCQVAGKVGAQLLGQEVASKAVWQLHETGHKCAIGPNDSSSPKHHVACVKKSVGLCSSEAQPVRSITWIVRLMPGQTLALVMSVPK